MSFKKISLTTTVILRKLLRLIFKKLKTLTLSTLESGGGRPQNRRRGRRPSAASVGRLRARSPARRMSSARNRDGSVERCASSVSDVRLLVGDLRGASRDVRREAMKTVSRETTVLSWRRTSPESGCGGRCSRVISTANLEAETVRER